MFWISVFSSVIASGLLNIDLKLYKTLGEKNRMVSRQHQYLWKAHDQEKRRFNKSMIYLIVWHMALFS